jgi:ribose 5-phosphate isomerase B
MAGQVVFLCTGNICRSPLAEALAGAAFADLEVGFRSAGLDAVDGLPASRDSASYAASLGLSLAGHRSQPVTAELLARTDWVVGMTRSHAAIFRSRWGRFYQGAVGILGAPGVDLTKLAHSPASEEVDDPYGQAREVYYACGDRIARMLVDWRDTFLTIGRGAGNRPEVGSMRIAIGSDHRGLPHKTLVSAALRKQGHEVADFGCHEGLAADYPDAALPVAESVADGIAQAGVLICGSGIGMSIAANKVKGIRASLCFTEQQARTTRQHNDSNVVCLSGDALPPAAALAVVTAWLDAEFEAGRHAARVAKITDYENRHMLDRQDHGSDRQPNRS